jgi:hypothetical protein
MFPRGYFQLLILGRWDFMLSYKGNLVFPVQRAIFFPFKVLFLSHIKVERAYGESIT